MATQNIVAQSSNEKLSVVFKRTYASPLYVYNAVRGNGDIWTVVECPNPDARKSGYSMRYSLLRNGAEYLKDLGNSASVVLSVACDCIQALEE